MQEVILNFASFSAANPIAATFIILSTITFGITLQVMPKYKAK